MSQSEQTLNQLFAANLGISVDKLKNSYRNPNNLQIFNQAEHNDIWGAEAKLFSYCLQEVRERAGPYQIFGSREVNSVGVCLHRHVDAWVKARRTVYGE